MRIDDVLDDGRDIEIAATLDFLDAAIKGKLHAPTDEHADALESIMVLIARLARPLIAVERLEAALYAYASKYPMQSDIKLADGTRACGPLVALALLRDLRLGHRHDDAMVRLLEGTTLSQAEIVGRVAASYEQG